MTIEEKLKDTTVLIVEDDPAALEALSSLLSHYVRAVFRASNGQEGWEAMERYNPDLVITDLCMPIMNGSELGQRIKSHYPQTPILVATAYGDSHENLSFADQVLLKPINHQQLRSAFLSAATGLHNRRLLEDYKAAIDRSTIVSKTDTKGVITYANEKFCQISSYSIDELVGKPHNIVRHPDMPAAAFKDMWQTIQSGQPWHGIVKNRAKDGRTYIVDTSISPLTNDRGEIVEYIGIRTDITETEELRERLAHELERTKEGYDASMIRTSEYERAIKESAILSRTDTEGTIIYVNELFCKVTGFDSLEALGHTHAILRHPDNEDGFYLQMWHTLKAGHSWHSVIKNHTKTGQTIWLDTHIIPIKNAQGEVEEYFGIRHDITPVIQLHAEIEQTQREVIYRMGEIGEMRNKETGYHVRRVAEYAALLAHKWGLDAEECNLIRDAAPMHDIGKVGISDSILLKPGKLTEEEFEVMRSHSLIGYEVLKNSDRAILKAAATIAYEHHEKYDGSGYPRRLAGESIHIYGRITALADVFDALGSDRPYKKAWPLERILELLQSESGKHFDPVLVDLFFANLDEFLAIAKKWQD